MCASRHAWQRACIYLCQTLTCVCACVWARVLIFMSVFVFIFTCLTATSGPQGERRWLQPVLNLHPALVTDTGLVVPHVSHSLTPLVWPLCSEYSCLPHKLCSTAAILFFLLNDLSVNFLENLFSYLLLNANPTYNFHTILTYLYFTFHNFHVMLLHISTSLQLRRKKMDVYIHYPVCIFFLNLKHFFLKLWDFYSKQSISISI